MSAYTHETHGISMGKYIVGFVLSVILTLLAFYSVMAGWLVEWSLNSKVIFLLGLAIIQMVVQIMFFLHLNEGPDAKWNIMGMWVAVFCVFVIIFGTWWTMRHLNYNMMGGSGRVQVISQAGTPARSEAAVTIDAEVTGSASQ